MHRVKSHALQTFSIEYARPAAQKEGADISVRQYEADAKYWK
jgi:hypothetical protein